MIDTRQNADGTTTHVLAHPVELDGKKQIVTFDVRRNAGGELELESGGRLRKNLASDGEQNAFATEQSQRRESMTVAGTAANPSVKWEPNPNGVIRTLEQALAIAKEHGVKIPSNIKFKPVPPSFYGQDIHAQYCHFNGASKKNIFWRDFFEKDGLIHVGIDERILASDEGIVGIFAHEMHELNNLAELYKHRDPMPSEVLHGLIDGQRGTLHSQAWDLSDRKILEMRKQNYYENIRQF